MRGKWKNCVAVSQKRCEIGPRLLLITNKKSYTGSRLPLNSMTLDDLERQNRGFCGFLAISGCDTSLYDSQDGATQLLLCDPNREVSICILT